MSTLLGTRTTLLLLLITVSAIMAMQILAPALPAIAADFEVAAGTAQLTLTLFLVSYALFQLVYGHFVEDKYPPKAQTNSQQSDLEQKHSF